MIMSVEAPLGQGRYGLAGWRETQAIVPVGLGAPIENPGWRMAQYLAQCVRADAVVQCLQILGGAIGHDMRQEMNGVGQRLFRLFEPDHAAGYGQQGRSCRQGVQDWDPW